jgi:hypothetical protein
MIAVQGLLHWSTVVRQFESVCVRTRIGEIKIDAKQPVAKATSMSCAEFSSLKAAPSDSHTEALCRNVFSRRPIRIPKCYAEICSHADTKAPEIARFNVRAEAQTFQTDLPPGRQMLSVPVPGAATLAR